MPFKRNLFAYLVKHDILNAGHKNALQQFEARMIKKLVRNQIIKESFINGLGAKILGWLHSRDHILSYSGLSQL